MTQPLKKLPQHATKLKTKLRPEALAYGKAQALIEKDESPLRGDCPADLFPYVRDASYFDSDAIAAANVAAWLSAYRGVMPEAVLKEFTIERFETRWEEVFLNPPDDGVFTLVAVDDEYGVTGYLRAGPAGDSVGDPEFTHEIYAVNVAPRFKRLGSGRALMEAGLRRLMLAGARSCFAWALEANTPARFFLKGQGAAPAGKGIEKVGPLKFSKIAYGWADLGALYVEEPRAIAAY